MGQENSLDCRPSRFALVLDRVGCLVVKYDIDVVARTAIGVPRVATRAFEDRYGRPRILVLQSHGQIPHPRVIDLETDV